MAEWDIQTWVVGGTGLAGAITILITKGISFFRNEQTAQANSGAQKTSFDTLRLQIEALQADNADLRREFHIMDNKLHKQQTKLTRTEMLVRQFVGLVREHGITVPGYMQAELDDILADERPIEEPRPADARTRATDSKVAPLQA